MKRLKKKTATKKPAKDTTKKRGVDWVDIAILGGRINKLATEIQNVFSVAEQLRSVSEKALNHHWTAIDRLSRILESSFLRERMKDADSFVIGDVEFVRTKARRSKSVKRETAGPE
jgi:hypothetical protein